MPLPFALVRAVELALLVGCSTEPPQAGRPMGGVGEGNAGFIGILDAPESDGVNELQLDPDAGGRLML